MRDTLEAYFQNGDFESILNSGDGFLSKLYKCKVYLKLGKNEESLGLTKELYDAYEDNIEVVQVFSKALLNNNMGDESVNVLKGFVANNKSEGVLRALIETLIGFKRFEEAAFYNDMREASVNTIEKNVCVAIQCFNKPTLLRNTLESLLSCDSKERVSVAILQDNHIGSNYKKNYEDGFNETRNIISLFLPRLHESFENVSILKNEKNRGTAPSCRALLDYCFNNHNAVIFIEDDFILSKDALLWTKYLIDHEIGNNDCFFGSCESVFFDSKGVAVENDLLEKLKSISRDPELSDKFILESFVPSTCFITTKEIWSKCSSIRGSIRGPESLNSWLREMGKKTIFPIVPRGCDVGMMDDNGYSVAMLGKDNVKETKSTYLMSGFNKSIDEPKLFLGNKDLVYSATTLLNKESIEKLLREE